MKQIIHQAREGIHSTISGDYIVEHRGSRTYCTSVKEKSNARFEPESNSGGRAGWYDDEGLGFIYRSLEQRQEIADQNFSPRRNYRA